MKVTLRSSFARASMMLFAALFSGLPAAAADFATNFGGAGVTMQINGTALDGAGNSYVAGFFNTANMITPSLVRIGTQDGFVIKVDSSGTIVWGRNFSGAGATTQFSSVAVGPTGNVYVGGFFQTADLTVPPLTRIGTKDAVVIKLDSSGNLAWARNYGGAGVTAQAMGLAVDSADNVHMSGFFNAASMTTPTLTKIGLQDMLALKIDSGGSLVWARNYGGAGATAQGNGVAVDGGSNVYLAATLNAASMTTPAITRLGGRDMLLFKLDSTGSLAWTRNYGGPGANANGIAVAVDGAGGVYLAGHFFGADFTVPPLAKIGSTDAVVIKHDSAGTMNWAQNVGGTIGAVNVAAACIGADSAGNAYLGGYFQSGNLTTPFRAIVGADDAYAIKFDSRDGAAVWSASYATATTISFTNGLKPDATGALYVGGYFFGSQLFQDGVSLLTKIGTTDGFLIKQSTTPDPPATVTASPGDTLATVVFGAPVITGGGAITSYTVTSNPGGFVASGASSPLVVTGLTNGTAYTFTVTATNAMGASPASVPSNSVTPSAAQTISFPAPGIQVFATSPTLTATATSTLPVTFTSTTLGVCTITPGGALTFVAAGSCTINADQAGDTFFSAAPQASQTFAVDKAAQAITFGVLAARAFGSAAFSVSAIGGASGNPVTFSSLTPAVCSTSGSNGTTVTLLGAGTCTIAADQASNGNYNAAPQVPRSFSVSMAPQVIAFAALPGRALGDAAFTVSATGGTSGNPVTFSSLTPAACTSGGANGATVTVVAAGTCTIAADQAGNGNYSAAARVSNSFTVAKGPQVISFAALASRVFGSAPFTVAATGGASGNVITFTSTTPAACTTGGANGATVTLVAVGTCTLAANQGGDANYDPATQATQSFQVTTASFTGPSATGTGSITASFTGGGPGCGFSAPEFIPLTGHASSPPAGSALVSFPHGLFSFSTTGCVPGSTLNFTITYPSLLFPGTQYWKYGPTPGNAGPHWYLLPATVAGNVITFSITDGAIGDDDLAANGTIVDQGGPGIGGGALTQVPTLGEWALALLALLMLGLGAARFSGSRSARAS